MRVTTIFAGALGALLFALPAAAQRGPDQDAQAKAEAARLAADPALSPQANADFLANNAKQPGVQKRPDGLQYRILQNGFGSHPLPGDTVEVYYTVRLLNGKLVDGTSPGLPASFALAAGQLIAGWVEALQLMRVGDHWQLWVPSTLGYSASDAAARGLPPGQTMVFDLRLLSTTAAPKKGERGYVPQPGDQDDQK